MCVCVCVCVYVMVCVCVCVYARERERERETMRVKDTFCPPVPPLHLRVTLEDPMVLEGPGAQTPNLHVDF